MLSQKRHFGRVNERKYIRLQDEKGQVLVFQLFFFINSVLEHRMMNEFEQSVDVKFLREKEIRQMCLSNQLHLPFLTGGFRVA